MTSTIRETIEDNLPGGARQYRTEVEAVTRVLETREALIAEQIISAGVSVGLDPANIKRELAETGITMPSEPVEQANINDDRVARLEARVAEMDNVVAEHVRTIGELRRLAERHLGASV